MKTIICLWFKVICYPFHTHTPIWHNIIYGTWKTFCFNLNWQSCKQRWEPIISHLSTDRSFGQNAFFQRDFNIYKTGKCKLKTSGSITIYISVLSGGTNSISRLRNTSFQRYWFYFKGPGHNASGLGRKQKRLRACGQTLITRFLILFHWKQC